MNLTTSQKNAIDRGGKDMLVSAGAGSGKTTVLAKRLLKKIESGADIGDFLVVTFTNSAAADLKAKLSARLKELCDAHPDNKGYLRQLYALPTADIGTIDSFCLQYVKQYATALELGGTSVGDEALCGALLTDSAEKVLTELCDEDSVHIDILLDNFANHKSDSGLITAMVSLYKAIRSYPFYIEWLHSKVYEYLEEEKLFSYKDFLESNHGKTVKIGIEEKLKAMEEDIKILYATAENEKQAQYAETLDGLLTALNTALSQGYDAFSAESALTVGLRRPNKCSDGYVKAYEDFVKNRKGLMTFACTEEELKTEYRYTAEVLEGILEFISRLDRAYREEKNRRGVIDFADGEQCFLDLLVERTPKGLLKTPLCHQLATAYEEVYIDEYQDVSPLQDTIFRLIGTGKRFMVGDVKQSIYGFRGAYPDLFISYRDKFGDGDDSEGIKILLKENFRCDKGVVDFCNHVFSKIYTVESAGSDYKEEALVFSKNSKKCEKTEIRVFENAPDNEGETAYITAEVVKLIKGGRKPSDIAILCRRGAPLKVFATALSAKGVPVSLSVGKEELLKQPEVLLAISALRVIDNPTDDTSLAALLRSPVFKFTADELLSIRRGGSSLYEDMRHTALGNRERNRFYRFKAAQLPYKKLKTKPLLNKGGKDELSEKCKLFLEKLGIYRTKALILPVHKLLWHFYEESRIMSFAPQGKEKLYRANLLAFYRLAMSMEDNSYKGVSVFTEYLQRLEETKSSPTAEKEDAGEGVRLMTIHGSKGLEFPIVFVADCGSDFKKADRKQPITVSYRNGVLVKLKRQKSGVDTDTLLRQAELWAEDKRAIAEELRILYVAFTRAAEKLYITATLKKSYSECTEKNKSGSYFDLIADAVALNEEMYYNIRVKDMLTDSASESETLIAEDTEYEELPLPAISPTEKADGAQLLKLSASLIEKDAEGIFRPKAVSKATEREPAFAITAKPTAALKGTANHLFMQFADFARAEESVKAEADRLLEKGFISAEERTLMDEGALERFFKAELYGKMKASPKLYREKRFTTTLDGALFGAESSPLLQGVIDCFFLNEEGGYTLVDYKTDYAKAGMESLLAEKHGVQLKLYSLYVEKTTGKPVTKAYIYSFALGKAIECKI